MFNALVISCLALVFRPLLDNVVLIAVAAGLILVGMDACRFFKTGRVRVIDLLSFPVCLALGLWLLEGGPSRLIAGVINGR